jgi:hypothetical protein
MVGGWEGRRGFERIWELSRSAKDERLVAGCESRLFGGSLGGVSSLAQSENPRECDKWCMDVKARVGEFVAIVAMMEAFQHLKRSTRFKAIACLANILGKW